MYSKDDTINFANQIKNKCFSNIESTHSAQSGVLYDIPDPIQIFYQTLNGTGK